MLDLPVASLSGRGEADELLSRDIKSPMLRQFLLQNLVREGDRYRWRINLEAIEANQATLRDFPADLADKSWPGPALFIDGENSDYIQPAHHAVIHRLFPRAGIKTIKDAAHWVHADKPDEVIAAFRDFLSSST